MKQTQIRVKKRNGTLAPYDPNKINKCAIRACEGLDGVSASELILDSQLNIFDKITTEEIDRTLLLKAREKMYLEPNWGLVASRILVSCVYKEVMNESVDSDTFDSDYRAAFIKNIKKGVKAGILSERLLNFDLKRLAAKIVPERDNTIDYVGMQNLADRYFLRDRNKKLLETPQAFYMRVAMGVSIPEFDFGKMDANDVAEKLYEIYTTKLATPSTPTLFNAGTVKSQNSSCYLGAVGDSLDSIYESLWQNARLSKHAGGLGFHVTPIRSTGAYIAGTNGKSSGLIPWLKNYNDMLIAVDQGSRRPGSGCAYLEPWHPDVEEFIDLRKSNGEERRRCHDLNIALWCPDLFFKRIEEDSTWTLFCPSECPDLHESYGEDFEKKYEAYEKLNSEGKLKHARQIKAKDLWKNILKSLFETSSPWICYKDIANKRYPNKDKGILHGSNLCVAPETKILTFDGEREIKDLAGLTVEVWNGKEWSLARCEKTGENQKLIKIGVSVQGFFGHGEDIVCGSSIDESILYVTEYHKFYSDEGLEMRASDLKVGQRLENWINPENGYSTKVVYVSSIEETGRYDDTYCVNEPKRHRAMFNGVLTGNCTEIFEHTIPSKYQDGEKTEIGETAVCTLASINVYQHLDENGKLDKKKMEDTIKWLSRALDNVVSANFYPTKEAKKSAMSHRNVGMGCVSEDSCVTVIENVLINGERMPISEALKRAGAKNIKELLELGQG